MYMLCLYAMKYLGTFRLINARVSPCLLWYAVKRQEEYKFAAKTIKVCPMWWVQPTSRKHLYCLFEQPDAFVYNCFHSVLFWSCVDVWMSCCEDHSLLITFHPRAPTPEGHESALRVFVVMALCSPQQLPVLKGRLLMCFALYGRRGRDSLLFNYTPTCSGRRCDVFLYPCLPCH